MKAEMIKIDTLVTEGLQIRRGIDRDVVAEYAEAMKDGTEFPPVVVFGRLLADGFHRVEAAKALGLGEIAAEVREGGFEDALRYALGANAAHGLRRSNADKRHALEIAWLNREKLFGGKDPSKRELAAVCGVSDWMSCMFIKERQVVDSTTSDPDGESAAAGVKANLEKGLDRFGTAIPETILPAFRGFAPLRKIARSLRDLKGDLEDRIKGGDPAFAAVPQQAVINLENSLRELKLSQPYCVCRGCAGTGCYRCGDHGFQTVMQYKRLPEEFK